ncbi:MAG: DNA recombination protein RmuC [Terracidiphilus sp.]
MQTWIAIVVAALAGIAVGFFLRGVSARTERRLLEQRSRESADALNAANAALQQSQAESAARAGFESLASERERNLTQLTAERDGLRGELQTKAGTELNQSARIKELESDLRNERQSLAEKLALLEDAKKALSNQFQALAAEILDQKSKSFSEGSQKELGTLLDPLKLQIKEFREKVEQAQTDSKTGVTKLETLIGALGGLNQQLSEEARNLTTALRGSAKAQGDWGEFILRDLLEKAGLREGEQYSFQQSFSGIETGDGSKTKTARTDVIVFLPGGRNLVVDSKVSLTAYTDYVNATDDKQRESAFKQHLASVRGHVSGLAKAGYDRLPGIEAPDFVVMFVPVEPAFLIALQNDAALWADAYQQGILLVGPTTLLYIIRIVNVLWHQESQARNVREVMDRGAKLYEKFAGFVDDMEGIGKSLRDAGQSYEEAKKKLSVGDGNLIRQVEMLRQLGVEPKPRKPLPAKLLEAAEMGERNPALTSEAEATPDHPA